MTEQPITPSDPGAGQTAGAGTAATAESRRERTVRHAHRAKLYTYAILATALLVVIVALVVANTRHVKVSWVIGSSRQSLVWIVLAAAVLGWLLGIVTSIAFRYRTRAPRS